MADKRSFFHAVAICVGVLATGALLRAHDARVVGAYRLEIGWSEEPALAGMRNAVTVEITDATTHKPVVDLGGGSLSVELTFGDEHVVLPLHANPEQRNLFRASIVPTRAGTYAFHVTGKVKDQAIDVRSTCSPQTFDCVGSSADIQFPARDPSPGELAERIERSSPRAERALDVAGRAQMLAAAALGAAALAIVIALARGVRRGSQGG
jgi:hypothetical protein